MSKGVAALAYLPEIDLVLPTGNAVASIEAFRGLANLVAKMQADEVADGTYEGAVARGNNPYDSSVWDIVISDSGTTFTCTFVSEEVIQNTGAVGRAALSTRRKIDILKLTGVDIDMRSFLALINFIEKLEDQVAQTGTATTADDDYVGLSLRGNTPFKTYSWSIRKANAVYTVVAGGGALPV
tara:strand:- start:4203 stop:4751 length:549 start_codon:yes stop_codon:yes gene_type:complete